MDLRDLINQDSVVAGLRSSSKKQVIQVLSDHAAKITGLSERLIFDTLLQRERLGSTGVGHGIAIPHGKFEKLDQIVGLFAKLEKPIDFEAQDNEPVDLIFLLLAPEGAGADHLKALSRVARTLRDPVIAEKVRASSDGIAIYSILTEAATSNAA